MHSEHNTSAEQDEAKVRSWYKQEPWLALCLSCFVPLFAAIYAPTWLKTPLLVLCGVLFATSMVLLSRHTSSK